MVRKRTKVRCPSCVGDFYIFPDGHIEQIAEQDLPVAEVVPVPKKRKNRRHKKARSSRHSTVRLNEGEIIPHRTVTRSGRQRKTMFESGDFDGSATGFSFETVTGLEESDLNELRQAASVEDQLADQSYQVLPNEDERDSQKRSRTSTPKRKGLLTSNEDFRILPESDAPTKTNQRRKKKTTGKAKRSKTQPKSKQQSEPSDPEKRKAAAETSSQKQLRSSSSRRADSYKELNGEALSRARKRSSTWVFMALLFALPLLFFGACLISTTRGQGFAANGSLGQQFDTFGQSLQRAVKRLQQATTGS